MGTLSLQRSAKMTTPPVGPSSSEWRGLVGVARENITAPAGIHWRNWAASPHEVAHGVHRPLTLTCLTFRSSPQEKPLVLIGADLGWWRSREDEWSVRGPVLEALSLDQSRLMFCLSHTHAGPGIEQAKASLPGGELVAPYLARVRDAALSTSQHALNSERPATLSWRYGKCDLATNRDLQDPAANRLITGYNPLAPADDTLLIGRVSDDNGSIIATMANYACHPTIVAWDNRLLSPDYIGAMREVVETRTQAPCLFLQGASGELAPAEQYTSDTALADRHGRRVGYCVLATLEAMEAPGMRLSFKGVVESGAPLAIWRQERTAVETRLAADMVMVELSLKSLPSLADLEARWRECKDRVLKERLWRDRAIRKLVGDGPTTKMPLWVWRIGDALLAGQPNETYSYFQQHLRAIFKPATVAVMNVVNGWVGYLPPAALYDRDVYSVWQTPFARGGLERLTEVAENALAKWAKRRETR
jgi:hypothetical protein